MLTRRIQIAQALVPVIILVMTAALCGLNTVLAAHSDDSTPTTGHLPLPGNTRQALTPMFAKSLYQIAYPAWVDHGQQLDTPLTIENYGNTDLVYSIELEEETGPSGWLTTSDFSGYIPAGPFGYETGIIHFNTGGIVNEPGTVVELTGRLIFLSNSPSNPDTLPVTVFVTSHLEVPSWDTASTACLSFVVKTDGNIGNRGNGGIGRVNMDY